MRPFSPLTHEMHDAAVTSEAVRYELVYREHGARPWRSVFLYSGDREVSSVKGVVPTAGQRPIQADEQIALARKAAREAGRPER